VAGFGFHQLAVGSKDTLNAANFEAAMLALSAQKRPDGSPLGVKATHLVCGPTNEGKARTLLLKQTLAAGEDNIWFNAAKPHFSAWLD
jgi:phage major head subunit gpT-like protein